MATKDTISVHLIDNIADASSHIFLAWVGYVL